MSEHIKQILENKSNGMQYIIINKKFNLKTGKYVRIKEIE